MDVRLSPLWTALAAFAAVAAIFAAGFAVGITNAATPEEPAPASEAFPDWFLPIWDAYDRNPAITPQFDFAGLYSGTP